MRHIGLWDARVAFFHAPMDEETYVYPPRGLRRRGAVWILRRALYGARVASKLFGRFLRETLTKAGLSPLALVPNAYYHAQRDIECVVHGDNFMAGGEDRQLDFLEKTLADNLELQRVGRVGPGRD